MKKFAGVIAGLVLVNQSSSACAEELAAARNIRAGTIVTTADILTPGDRDSLRRAFKLVGLEAMRTYYRGQKIDSAHFKSPTLVKRNAIVQMQFEHRSLTILTEGRALDPGGLGERIRVMNLLSKRVVSAKVAGADKVKAQQ